jgi:methionine sulfoxide reductase catalytic subunit
MLPVVALLFGAVIGVSIWLRTIPDVEAFIQQYPGSMANDSPQGFPWWLRWQHALNAIFLVPIVRAGVQIFAGRPRAYWRAPGTPGTDWLRIQRAMPAEDG